MQILRTIRAGEALTMDVFAQAVPPAYLKTAEAKRLRAEIPRAPV